MTQTKPGRPGIPIRVAILLAIIAMPVCLVLGYLGLRLVGRFLIVSDPLQSADAAAVLSGGDLDRLDTAAALLNDETVRFLILTNTDATTPSGRTMTDYLYSEATQRGIDVPQIDITREKVITTYDEARAVLALMQERGWNSVIIVTDPFHSRRTRFLFNLVFDDSGKSFRIHTVSPHWFSPGRWFFTPLGWETAVREYGKLIMSWLGHY